MGQLGALLWNPTEIDLGMSYILHKCPMKLGSHGLQHSPNVSEILVSNRLNEVVIG